MNTAQTRPSPIKPDERIIAVDLLRGVAVLGILIMNIQSFAMIQAAYFNPTAYGDLSGINRWVWIVSHVLGEQKFLSIFSILFGAGILLMTGRLEMQGQRPAGSHYRRMAWLLVIGLCHGYLLWYGDILVSYAMLGSVAYLFRRLRPRTLLITGLAIIAVSSALSLLGGWSIQFWDAKALEQNRQWWAPGAEAVARELAAFRGGWLEQMSERVRATVFFQTVGFFFFTSWRAGGLMLVGIALMKWGVLSGERSARWYRWLLVIGFGLGIPVVSYGVVANFEVGWTLEYSWMLGSQYNYWGSLAIAGGIIGAVMLLHRSGVLTPLREALSATGRMAFSNYLLQTLICTTLFYGHGLGLFGSVERWGQLLMVVGLWIVALIVSPLWLGRFRYGPVEWLWRSLTYWSLQPMRRGEDAREGLHR